MLYAVTVKLDKNPEHDPHNKQSGVCPIGDGGTICTDATGEHHTTVVRADNIEQAISLTSRWKHVTRIEEIDL